MHQPSSEQVAPHVPQPDAPPAPELLHLPISPQLRLMAGGLVGGDSLAAAAERAALERLEQTEPSEDVDPIEAEADRLVEQAAGAQDPPAEPEEPEAEGAGARGRPEPEPEPEPSSRTRAANRRVPAAPGRAGGGRARACAGA